MIRSGFFNSLNHDRLYYNSDISRLFNSLIIDGVFQNIGDKFIARPGTGMQVIIPSGFAYFNSTWLYNDADYIVALNAAPIVAGISRIDGIFLKMGPVDDQNGDRANNIYYMAGTPASSPARPTPTVIDREEYIPICYISIANDITTVTAGMITNMVGTSSCPFVSGILETIDADELLRQWAGQFTEWLTAEQNAYSTWSSNQESAFETWSSNQETSFTNWSNGRRSDFDNWFADIEYVLDGDAAGHLQVEIDSIVLGALVERSEM